MINLLAFDICLTTILQQKQTLNEVENLYFHHYRARIPPRSMPKIDRTTNAAAPASTQTAPEQPSASTLSVSASFSNSVDQQMQQQPLLSSNQSSAPVVAAESESVEMEVDPSAVESTSTTSGLTIIATQLPFNHSASPIVTPPSPQPPPAPQRPATTKTPPLPGVPTPSHPTQNSTSFSTSASTPTPSFVASPSTSRNPVYSQPSSSSMRSRGASPATRPSSSAATSSIPSSSSAVMTYDSFWSSHGSTTSTNYRSALTNTASFNGPGRGDAGMGLTNFGPGYPFAMGASSAPFQPLPIPKRQAVSRKRAVQATTGSVRQGLTGGESTG